MNPNRAYVLLVDYKKAEVLLIKNIVGRGGWSLPGGGLTSVESHLQAACREVREEINLRLDPRRLKQLCVLPGRSKLRSGKRVYFVYALKKRSLHHNRLEILTVAWKSLTIEKGVDKTLQTVLKRIVVAD